MNKLLSIIIVNYHATSDLIKCLESIPAHSKSLGLEVVVVDNSLEDSCRDQVEAIFPSVKLVENKINVGYARACNQGLSIAAGEYILFLNPDTIVKKNALERCIEYMKKNTGVSLLGCSLLNENGTLQPSCADFPGLWNIFLDHLFVRMLPQELRGRFLVKYWSHDKTREVDWVLGAFMLTRRKIVCEVGGFDTDYFLYGEDTDLCYRIKQAGGKIIFSPEAEVIHIGNPIWDLERKKRVYNAYLTFYRKHFSMSSLLLLKILITLKLFMVRRSFDKLRTSSRRSSGF